MESGIKKKELLDLKTDITLLLECLEYQKEDPSSMKQVLMTLSSIVQTSDQAKDVFRDCEGIPTVLTIARKQRKEEVVETALYCLGSAAERNVYSQKLLTTASVFTFLHGILSSPNKSSVRKKQTASFLALVLVSNNGFGQNLMRQSSCLHDVITLIRTTLPRNMKELDGEWLEGMEGRSLNLWSTLLSTACASVNNPLNEENQRICAGLFPYLFSLLSKQTDDRIIRPILSLVGLAVSGFANNQDRVRKCGGLEVFVNQLEKLKTSAITDSSSKQTAVHLLSTMDACISDNQLSSKQFGDLGGIRLVLEMLTECCLDTHDKTQAVLTLAHAVDAYGNNQRHIMDGGGMAVLIQQLTETQDEELSKTTKYLLHMCVSSGKTAADNKDIYLSDAECLISKMESMKRHNDTQMLKKINELDSKLKSMEKKSTCWEREAAHSHTSYIENRSKSCTEVLQVDDKASHSSSHDSNMRACQQDCPTPREKSLMEQLVKEKSEKERLEKLNHMLQENMCRTYATLSSAWSVPKNLDPAKLECSNKKFVIPTNSANKDICGDSLMENSPVIQLLNQISRKYDSCKETGVLSRQRPVSSPSRNSSQDLSQNVGSKQREGCQTIDRDCGDSVLNVGLHGTSVLSQKDLQNQPTAVLDTQASYNLQDTENKADQEHTYSSTLLDQNQTVSSTLSETQGNLIDSYTAAVLRSNTNNSNTVPQAGGGGTAGELKQNKKQKMNRHAEIQCGTPCVANPKKQSDINNSSIMQTEERLSRTSVLRTPNNQSSKDFVNSAFGATTGRRLLNKETVVKDNVGKEDTGVYCKADIGKTPVIVLTDYRTELSENRRNSPLTRSASKLKSINPSLVSVTSASKNSDNLFVKPVALPPKSKLRVTPSLGSNKTPLTKIPEEMNSASASPGYESEFDNNLVKNIVKEWKVRPTAVVKSQNNVRKIDKIVEKREENAAVNWVFHPATPKQPILPPRPAYSDCGLRRLMLETPYSVKSSGRRRSLDDSGIHSPVEHGGLPSKLETSPVDSNVDDLRSSSDVSDEEVTRPIINTEILRSKRRKTKPLKEKCPGCNGFYNPGKGLELNSRTYNIALETDPNTCKTHRELRQIERGYVQQLRRSKRLADKRKLKLTEQKLARKRKESEKKTSIYQFTSDSDPEISPLSDENIPNITHPQRSKKRRKRIPYTQQEEWNLLDGVQTLGKHWNQILATYDFHPSRTNIDLMDKYKRIGGRSREGVNTRSMSAATRTHRPFSMCEERRLRRGVLKYGYNWKTILRSFTFAQGRTTDDLRNKWRTLHKK